MAKHKPLTKEQSLRIHAKKRAEERYGIQLNRVDLRNIAEMVQKNESICIEVQTNRVSIHFVKFNGTKIKIAYDKQRKAVISVLPLEPKPVVEIQNVV